MFHQAQRVSWLVRDRDEAHYIHLRMRVRNADTGTDGRQGCNAGVREFARRFASTRPQMPKPHVFRLTPVPTGTTQSTR